MTLPLLWSIARLHIVAIGALGTLTFAWALCGVRPVDLALLTACDWFVVNLMNRVCDETEDAKNGIIGTDVVARNRGRTLAVGAAVLVASLLASASLRPATLVPRVAFHALGFAYNWRLLPGPAHDRARRRRIKELALWKNVASATGFLLTCFAVPLVSHPLAADIGVTTVAITVAFFFFFELGYEVLYDLRDLEGDRAAGVRTWPVLLGAQGGALVAMAETLLAVVIVVVAFVAGALPWHIAIMGVAPLLQLSVVGPRLPLAGRPNRITTGACIGITWLGAALLATYHLWEILGLPGSTGRG